MASTRPRTCGECAYLERTSAEQVFLRCRFWCGNHHSVHDQHYVETHCHMQPWATACDWWLRKEIGESK